MIFPSKSRLGLGFGHPKAILIRIWIDSRFGRNISLSDPLTPSHDATRPFTRILEVGTRSTTNYQVRNASRETSKERG
jgi:hypothetical protein